MNCKPHLNKCFTLGRIRNRKKKKKSRSCDSENPCLNICHFSYKCQEAQRLLGSRFSFRRKIRLVFQNQKAYFAHDILRVCFFQATDDLMEEVEATSFRFSPKVQGVGRMFHFCRPCGLVTFSAHTLPVPLWRQFTAYPQELHLPALGVTRDRDNPMM